MENWTLTVNVCRCGWSPKRMTKRIIENGKDGLSFGDVGVATRALRPGEKYVVLGQAGPMVALQKKEGGRCKENKGTTFQGFLLANL